MFCYDLKGIRLNGAELWLDAHRKVKFSFVSHGHSDHIKNHDRILATPATARFQAMRSTTRDAVILDFGETLEIEDLKIQLYPAGHILGSAMIHIQKDGQSLLYSGDFRLGDSWTAEKIQIPKSDILIMESTYGNPHYIHNFSREYLLNELKDFIEDCFTKGFTPIVLAYSLGKSQEVIKALGEFNYSLRVHQSAWKFLSVYEEFGVKFHNCSLWGEENLNHGEILILPPHLLKLRKLHSIRRSKTVFLSGWANNRDRFLRYDHAISLSDHSDFNGLMEFIRQVEPQKIFTTHGFEDFPQLLCQCGYDARLLTATM